MVKLLHLTHAGLALAAIEAGRLESRAENIVRLAAERHGSHAKGEETLAKHFCMERFDQFDDWFQNNYLHCQTSLDAGKYPCVHDAGTRDELVLLRFETDGYVGACQFDFPGLKTCSTIRTILSKDEPDERLSRWTMPDLVGVAALSLEECTSIAVMPKTLGKILGQMAFSGMGYMHKIPVNILYRKENKWFEISMKDDTPPLPPHQP